MLHRLSANKNTFRPVEFKEGLNIILAERTTESTQKDTRNGLGKSTLIQILDFCLGAQALNGAGLCIPALQSWEFTLELTVAGNRICATRRVDAPSQIMVSGPTGKFIEQPSFDPEAKKQIYTLEEWRTLLGWAFFNLPRPTKNQKYNPTYRGLIPYFIRQTIDAYSNPFSHFRQQKPWQIQVSISYLLGLNWEYAKKWQDLKDQEIGVKAIETAIGSGVYSEAFGTLGEMETERVKLETLVDNGRKELQSFKVHPQYDLIQADANSITAAIHELINQNMLHRRRLARYIESISEENPGEVVALDKLYKEAGVVFGDKVKHTLNEAREFHSQILKNRKLFLETEVDRLGKVIAATENAIKEKTELRAKSLEILNSHGALQEMSLIQEKYVKLQEQLEHLRSKIAEIRGISAKKRKLKTAKSDLVGVAEKDHEERRSIWTTPIQYFNANSQSLYNTPGSLIVEISESGYKFDVEIERSGSEGIGKMKVFCFDLMLLQLAANNSPSINFLIHDSSLYDGVDSRQKALAIELAASATNGNGKQYICMLNSDAIPASDFSKGFNLSQYVRLTLTDKDASGSLLGIRFDRPAKTKKEG